MFGMCGSLYSNSPIHVLATTPAAFRRPSTPSGLRNSPDFIDGATLVYSAAGLGVVHDLATNSQLFFDGHEDDVTCVTVSPDGTYAATGQVSDRPKRSAPSWRDIAADYSTLTLTAAVIVAVAVVAALVGLGLQMGKQPRIYVWPTNIPRSESKKCIADVGAGFFERGVCAMGISWDNKYIVGVGCDDMHMMGVFEILSGALIEKASCQHGIPPQIRWINYCRSQQHTEYITRAHAGPCDMFAIAGSGAVLLMDALLTSAPFRSLAPPVGVVVMRMAMLLLLKCLICCFN